MTVCVLMILRVHACLKFSTFSNSCNIHNSFVCYIINFFSYKSKYIWVAGSRENYWCWYWKYNWGQYFLLKVFLWVPCPQSSTLIVTACVMTIPHVGACPKSNVSNSYNIFSFLAPVVSWWPSATWRALWALWIAVWIAVWRAVLSETTAVRTELPDLRAATSQCSISWQRPQLLQLNWWYSSCLQQQCKKTWQREGKKGREGGPAQVWGFDNMYWPWNYILWQWHI